MFDLTVVPAEVAHLGKKWLEITKIIRHDLESGIVKVAASYIPEGEPAREALVAMCDLAIKGCVAASAVGDDRAITTRLQGLASDIVQMQHDPNKSISHYVIWVETILRHLFA